MSEKREIVKRLMRVFSDLKGINDTHFSCIADFQVIVKEFVESDLLKYPVAGDYANYLRAGDLPPTDQFTTILPSELLSTTWFLLYELEKQLQELTSNQKTLQLLSKQLCIALDNCENCACCGNLCASNLLRLEPVENGTKMVCPSCYEEAYFDCHKCKRILPNSEIGVDDGCAGYGYICKDCIKPMGFPNEVVIAPDFEGCEDVAAADLAALCKYARRSTVWMEPDSSDTIKLKLVERLSEHDAIYENKNGLKYEIGKLDWRGIGSMQAAEDK